MAFTDDFKRRLNLALERSGLSRSEFARACGVSSPTVTKWLDESTQMTPELKKLGLICSALKVSASYLVQGDEATAPPDELLAKAREMAGDIFAILGGGTDMTPSPSRRGKTGIRRSQG